MEIWGDSEKNITYTYTCLSRYKAGKQPELFYFGFGDGKKEMCISMFQC